MANFRNLDATQSQIEFTRKTNTTPTPQNFDFIDFNFDFDYNINQSCHVLQLTFSSLESSKSALLRIGCLRLLFI